VMCGRNAYGIGDAQTCILNQLCIHARFGLLFDAQVGLSLVSLGYYSKGLLKNN